jgi:NAD+ kinase
MFPHTLTSRPLVINDQSQITLHLSLNNQITSHLSCDGQFHLELAPGDEIVIKRYAYSLRLIHPEHHNYFEVLRQKLGWSTQC